MIRAVPYAEQTKDRYYDGLWHASLICEGHEHSRKQPKEMAAEIMKFYRNEQLKGELNNG